MDVKESDAAALPETDADIAVTKEAEGIQDVAADLFLEIGHYSPEELESERKTVRKKIDMVILPM